VKGASGSARITGAELRAAISAWDGRIWINQNRNIVGPIRDEYDDVRCRPGLPVSPIVSVSGGARQEYRRGGIYRNAHADVTVWLRGSIFKEYKGLGPPRGRLGLPISKVATVQGPAGGSLGSRINFEGGRIYAKAGAKAHALWGSVLKEYLSRGAATGSLGFPTSRVHADGSGGTTATFEQGVVTCDAGSCSVS
jgi:hypothetical protein